MRIEYLGHASFYFKDGQGTTAIIDPYDETVGYRVPSRPADYTMITHGHRARGGAARRRFRCGPCWRATTTRAGGGAGSST